LYLLTPLFDLCRQKPTVVTLDHHTASASLVLLRGCICLSSILRLPMA
jgi:hypothetical protein